MQLCNITDVENFKSVVARTQGAVWLESPYGDKYNLKSALSQYVAIGKLISSHGDELELFCSDRADEGLFLKFFSENPQVL